MQVYDGWVKGRALAPGAALIVAIGLGAGIVDGGGTAQAGPAPARIAFSSGGRIFTIEADGSNRNRLTGGLAPRPGETADYSPVWSPDGTRLAFARALELADDDYRTRIYLMQADGTGQEPLTGSERRAYVSDPEWSPGGGRLALTRFSFSRDRLVSSIVVIRADGSGEHAIVRVRIGRTHGFAFVTEPAWSPDGTRIAYTKTALDTDTYYFHPSLQLVRPDGTGTRLLRRDAGSAAWSPGGGRIAFASIRDRNGADCGSDECSYRPELYVMDADGTQLVRLTRTGGAETEPSWSADGQRIVFSSNRNHPVTYGDPELYSIRPNGHCLTWLTNGSPGSSMPSWEPDPLASTDPGACGATPRPPLIEYDATPAERVRHINPMWLGERFGPMLLDYVDAYKSNAFFDYGDCGRYFPSDCGPDVQVQDRWVCNRTLLSQSGSANRLMKRRGALVAYRGREGGLEVYTGRQEVKIYLLGGGDAGALSGHLAALRALRSIHATQPPDRLRSPVVPSDLLHRLRRTERIHDRLGGVEATAERLGVSSREVRSRLRLARKLERFDHLGKVVCPSR